MELKTYLLTHPKKYLIFDLDETLALLHIDWSTIREDVFKLVATFDEELTKEVPRELYASIYLSNKAIKKYGSIAKTKLTTFVEDYEKRNYSGYTPNKELIDFIKSNDCKKYTCAIWTTNTTPIVRSVLAKEGLTERFEKIITNGDVSQYKPEGDGFSLIHVVDTPLSDYLMIGDSINDEGAAKNAGIDFFRIEYFKK